MFVFPNFICWMLTSSVMVLVYESMAFLKPFSHEDEALMFGISALIKETPESSLEVPSAMWGHSGKMAICEKGGDLPQTLNLPASFLKK